MVMHPLNFGLLIFACVVLLAFASLVVWQSSQITEPNDCEAAGGVYARTIRGWECLDVKTIKPPKGASR